MTLALLNVYVLYDVATHYASTKNVFVMYIRCVVWMTTHSYIYSVGIINKKLKSPARTILHTCHND